MNTAQVTLLSKKGMKELKKAITKLEQQQKQLISNLRNLDKTDTHDQRLQRVEMLARLEAVEAELDDKRAILRNSKLYPRKRDALVVAIGSVVELIDTQGRLVNYTLVESVEANPSDGRISIHSPLGKSLVGKTIRDTIEWGSRINPMQQMKLVAIR